MNSNKTFAHLTRRLLALAAAFLLTFGGLGTGRVAAASTTTPQSPSPFGFAVKTVDASTGAAKNSFYLGETVAVVFTLTNQSGVAQTILDLELTDIPLTLNGTLNRSGASDVRSGKRGGTARSRVDASGNIFWESVPKRSVVLAPGQAVSVSINDLSRFFATRLDDGSYNLTATYGTQQAQFAFTVFIDEPRSVPVLQQLATSSDEGDRRWANSYLNLINKPSVSGQVNSTAGQPVARVNINVTGSGTANTETRADGGYDVTHLTSGGNYTLTPALEGYTFEPAQRTYTGLTTKVTGANFTATRVRTGVNVASEDVGAVATASSTFNEDFPIESIINGSKTGIGWGQGSGGWNDATAGIYPDWVEVNFGASKYIDWINVFTLQDNFENPSEPTLTQTFTLYGITDFDVQYWDGTSWVTVPGGTVNANSNVWRKFEFPTLYTNKIRVNVRDAKAGHSRITEIEAFHANVPPKIKFLGLYQGVPGSTFQFNYSGSDSDGVITRYEWDFGDNTTGTGATQSHTYPNAGTYTVSLRVTDDGGEFYIAKTTVKIADPPQAPSAVAGGPYQAIIGADLMFDGRSSSDADGTISAYVWNFGDGTSGSGSTPTHAYTQAGTYTVTLTVTDNSGMTATATTAATITAQPTVTAPTGLLATTNTGAQVDITWASNSPPHHYQIERTTSLGGTFVPLSATPTINSFTDSSVASGGIYFYRVCAVDASGNKSGYTNIDVAATYVFTDPELFIGVTFVKSQHVTELRDAVNALRVAVGLPVAAWTDAQLPNTLIKAAHVLELRTNLEQALAQVGVPANTYTDAQLGIGYLIRKAHIEELRLRLK
jgi:PKD repeat protein